MKSGYDQFFKNARKVANDGNGVKFQKNPSPRLHLDLASEDIEEQIRRRMKMPNPKIKRKRKATIPWKLVGFSLMGLLLALWGFQNHEDVDRLVKRIEFTLTGEAVAENVPAKKEAKTAEATTEKAAATDGEKKEERGSRSEEHTSELQSH